MRWAALVLGVAALAACGRSGGGAQGGSTAIAPCSVVADAREAFRRPAVSQALPALNDQEIACAWSSEDGVIDASLITYAAGGAEAAEARMTQLVTEWSARSYIPPETLEGVGDAAVLVKQMGGNQSQIVLRKNGAVALILVSSGDSALTSDAAARRLAQAVLREWPGGG